MDNIKRLPITTQSVEYLMKKDKRFSKVVNMVGDITYKPYEDSYSFLVSQIIGQMLSAKVGEVIYGRLLSLCDNKITPQVIDSLSDEEIKGIGTANSKVKFIRELTSAVIDGRLDFKLIETMNNDEALKYLTNIYGIGKWSAKMYLIFVLDRQDILPYEDVAFLQAYKWLYKTSDVSSKSIIDKCKKWKPYSSIAARYMYKALDMGFTKNDFHLYK